MPHRLALVAAAFVVTGFTACGDEALRPDAGVHPPTSVQASALPACLTSGALLNEPASEVQRCAGSPCSVTPAGVNGSASEVWRYCGGACSDTCQDVATVHIINGKVMAVGTNRDEYRP